MTELRSNPFASLIDASAVLAVCETSQRLGALPTQAHLRADRPSTLVSPDVAEFDALIDACAVAGPGDGPRSDRKTMARPDRSSAGAAALRTPATARDASDSGAQWADMPPLRFPQSAPAGGDAARVSPASSTDAGAADRPGNASWTASQAWYTRQLESLGLA